MQNKHTIVQLHVVFDSTFNTLLDKTGTTAAVFDVEFRAKQNIFSSVKTNAQFIFVLKYEQAAKLLSVKETFQVHRILSGSSQLLRSFD